MRQEPSAEPTVLTPPATPTPSSAISVAECFITTIDPDGTGRVASAELFLEAFSRCL